MMKKIAVDDYMKIVKVAVAVAIIQNKPEGTSAYDYSRQLCGRCFFRIANLQNLQDVDYTKKSDMNDLKYRSICTLLEIRRCNWTGRLVTRS